MNQGGPHGGYGMQGVQRPPVPMQHQGYGGGPAQHGGWDNTRNQQQMNGTPSGPRGGRRGYGPSGNSFGQGKDLIVTLTFHFESFIESKQEAIKTRVNGDKHYYFPLPDHFCLNISFVQSFIFNNFK